jgi:hypothetical protein
MRIIGDPGRMSSLGTEEPDWGEWQVETKKGALRHPDFLRVACQWLAFVATMSKYRAGIGMLRFLSKGTSEQ